MWNNNQAILQHWLRIKNSSSRCHHFPGWFMDCVHATEPEREMRFPGWFLVCNAQLVGKALAVMHRYPTGNDSRAPWEISSMEASPGECRSSPLFSLSVNEGLKHSGSLLKRRAHNGPGEAQSLCRLCQKQQALWSVQPRGCYRSNPA